MKTNFNNIVQHVISNENDKYAQTFLKYCDRFDLPSEWLYRWFKTYSPDRIFQLIGLQKVNSTLFAIVKYKDEMNKNGFMSILSLTKSRFIGEELRGKYAKWILKYSFLFYNYFSKIKKSRHIYRATRIS